MIYHYCSIDAVIPIIESKCLWMSDIKKMNDPSEYILGFDWVIEEFKKLYPEHIDWIKYRHAGQSNRVLSTSFTKQGDMLSQWRAYAGDGTGISIGFDEEALLEINEYTQYDKINYSQSILKSKAQELISKHTVNDDSFLMKGFNTYDLQLAGELSKLAIFYKSNFYEEEEEIRLASYLSDDAVIYSQRSGELIEDREVLFRISKYGLIPYFNLLFCKKEKSAMKEVIIGPKSPLTVNDMTLLLECNKIHGVIVKKSLENYR
jgi:hypothetical protein